MITVKEIARRCNVSTSTVSNILNGRSNVGEQTRQKVMACVKETGYQPNYFAQNIRKQSNRLISIITEDLTVFGTNPMVEAIMAYCDDNNYRTVLMNLRLYKKWRDIWFHDNEKIKTELNPILQEALSIRVNGIIYVAGHCRTIDCFPPKFPIPVVIAYGKSMNSEHPSVIIDDEKGGYETTKYLLAKGHKNIGVIAGAADNLHTKYRLLGYQKALFEEGVLYNPSSVYYGDWKRETGYCGTKQILNENMTAIFCMNDAMAVGTYDYLYEKNVIVGQDISVVGYDNMELSDCLRPRLTTNGIQLSEIGRKSAEIMVHTLEDTEKRKNATMTFRIPCKMVERESVIALE